MSTKKPDLTTADFMALDVHQPLDPSLVDQETLIDHTTEEATARCSICFGPKPCPEHANVEQLPVITSNDMSPTAILAAAHNANLEHVVIVGMGADGQEYFAANMADAAEAMYYLQRGLHRLNNLIDRGTEHDEVDTA